MPFVRQQEVWFYNDLRRIETAVIKTPGVSFSWIWGKAPGEEKFVDNDHLFPKTDAGHAAMSKVAHADVDQMLTQCR